MISIQLAVRDTVGKVGTTDILKNDKITTMLWSFGLIILMIDVWHRIKDGRSPNGILSPSIATVLVNDLIYYLNSNLLVTITIVEGKQPEHNKTGHVLNRTEKLLLHSGKLPVDYFPLKMTLRGENISKILITSTLFKVQLSSPTQKKYDVVSSPEAASPPVTTDSAITIRETETPTLLHSPEITTTHEIAYETNIHLMGLTKESK